MLAINFEFTKLVILFSKCLFRHCLKVVDATKSDFKATTQGVPKEGCPRSSGCDSQPVIKILFKLLDSQSEFLSSLN